MTPSAQGEGEGDAVDVVEHHPGGRWGGASSWGRVGADVVNAQDGGVRQLRVEAGFFEEGLADGRVIEEFVTQDFHGDATLEPGVPGEEDVAECASGNVMHDDVALPVGDGVSSAQTCWTNAG